MRCGEPAQLSLDAYRKFDETRDGAAAVRLLKTGDRGISDQPFARRAPDVLATLDGRALDFGPRRRDLPLDRAAPPRRDASRRAKARDDCRRPIRRHLTERRTRACGRSGHRPALSASPVATLTRIRRVVLSDVVRVTIDVDSEVPFRQEQLDGPPRVFFDFAATRPAQDLADRTFRFEGDADIIRQIRVGRRPNATTRVVFDTAGSSDCSASPMYTPVSAGRRLRAGRRRESVHSLRPQPSNPPAPIRSRSPRPQVCPSRPPWSSRPCRRRPKQLSPGPRRRPHLQSAPCADRYRRWR